MSNLLDTLKRLLRGESETATAEMDVELSQIPSLSPEMVRELLTQIARTAVDDYACGDCDQLMAQYAEAAVRGEPASELMPRVQKHLDMCPPCREEFEALLLVLAAMEKAEE